MLVEVYEVVVALISVKSCHHYQIRTLVWTSKWGNTASRSGWVLVPWGTVMMVI